MSEPSHERASAANVELQSPSSASVTEQPHRDANAQKTISEAAPNLNNLNHKLELPLRPSKISAQQLQTLPTARESGSSQNFKSLCRSKTASMKSLNSASSPSSLSQKSTSEASGSAGSSKRASSPEQDLSAEVEHDDKSKSELFEEAALDFIEC